MASAKRWHVVVVRTKRQTAKQPDEQKHKQEPNKPGQPQKDQRGRQKGRVKQGGDRGTESAGDAAVGKALQIFQQTDAARDTSSNVEIPPEAARSGRQPLQATMLRENLGPRCAWTTPTGETRPEGSVAQPELVCMYSVSNVREGRGVKAKEKN